MKKFLIGLACGVALAGVAGLIIVFSMIRLGERTPGVADNSTLVLRLEGEIPEQPSMSIPLPMLEARAPATLQEIWEVLRKAEVDERVLALLIEPENLDAGWGKLEEIRAGLLRFKKTGKPVFAYLRSPGAREYYVASAADQIFLCNTDLLDLKGLRAELTFLRSTLDKVGVIVEAEHAGKYKDAADTFTRTSMTPETREVLDSILDEVYGRLLEAIASGRNKSAAEVRAIIDDGPFLAAQAKQKGLVDDLLFEDEVDNRLKQRLGGKTTRRVSHRRYARVPAASLGLEGKHRIAYVVAEGTILRGDGGGGFGESAAIYSSSFARLLRQVREDNSIRGVILRIDSPGGDAVASEEILHEVRRLSRKHPMVISMSDAAASGGYYMAMSGDPVLAYPNTITGSIGVIYGKVNLRGLYDKLGIRKELLTRGRNAAIDSDYGPMSDAARRKVQEGVQSTYESFLARVAEGRRRPVAEIAPSAEGRAWLGSQALRQGLVDELGGLDRAIELVREKAKIARGEKIRLVIYPRRKSIIEQIFGEREELGISGELRALLPDLDVRLWKRGGYLLIAPYTLHPY